MNGPLLLLELIAITIVIGTISGEQTVYMYVDRGVPRILVRGGGVRPQVIETAKGGFGGCVPPMLKMF